MRRSMPAPRPRRVGIKHLADVRRTRVMEWTTASQDASLLRKAGYHVLEFAQFRANFVEPVDRIDVARTSLDNAAAPALAVFAQNQAVAVLNVPVRNHWDLRALHGFIVEPAYRYDCQLLVQASADLDDLAPDTFSEPEFGYAWTLERLRYLATRYRRRSLDASRPPMTPIEEILLDALISVGLAPRLQYGVGPYRPDFAFPERLLIVEADGRGWHDAQRDRRRDVRLRQQGWEVIRFTGSEIFREASQCAEAVAKRYRSRPEAPDYSDAVVEQPSRSWLLRLLDWLKGLFALARPSATLEIQEDSQVDPLPVGTWCDDLDRSQREAVLAHEGVVQVIAPAGSGKTRVLVSRVRELVSRGVPEERILCTTFNKATEAELKARLGQVGVGEAAVRTFHSIGHFILKEEGRLRESIGSFSYAQWRRICSLAKGEEEGRVWIDAPEASEAVSNFKLGDMIDPIEAWERASSEAEKTAARIYALYEEELERSDRNDFDDLVINAVRLLRSDAAIRQKWQGKWECVLVDEYQDIEPAQELLIQLLAAPEDCLMVVGDEDQCIYTWRRAEVERIINLDKRYPGLKRAVLSTCYRCPADVVAAASQLIQNNERRFPKLIEAWRPAKAESSFGRPARVDGQSMADCVAQSLGSCDPAETVVLARTSRLLRDVALACAAEGVAFKAPAKVLRGAESEGVALAYMRLLAEPRSATPDDVDEVFRVPNRYLPDGRERDVAKELRSGKSFADGVGRLRVEEWRRKRLAEGAELLDRLKVLSDPVALLHALRTEGGLDKHYSDKERMAAHDQVEIEVLDALESEFSGKTVSQAVAAMEARGKVLENASSDEGVELTTIHGAKGREWSRVIVYGWDQDQLPHRRGIDPSKPEQMAKFIEDERRLAYVAMTRSTDRFEVVVVESPESQFSAEAGLADREPQTRQYVTRPQDAVVAAETRPPYTAPHRPHTPSVSHKPKRSGRLIKSQYDNTCAVCSRPVKIGDWICPVEYSGRKRWVHARCAED